jgi:cytidyltransferase-like protein
MYISELAEPTLLVIYPGRFQPFHKGHHAVYEWLCGKFGGSNVFIATSNKTDTSKSPFTFAEKAYFMQLTGVPANRVVQATSPYQIDSVLAGGQVTVNDPNNTVVIFAVSEKDMAEDPRFASWTKKDGSPAYFQRLENIKDTKSMQEHGYIMTVPTFNFTVLGQPATSASEIRAQYVEADEKTRQAIVKDLFGRYTREAEQIMNNKLAPQAAVEPARPTKLPKTAKAAGIKEATVYKDPEKPNLQIRPSGGMGTWDEPTLASSLTKQLDDLINQLKFKNYSNVEYLLYRAGAMKAKIEALARYEEFMKKQGRRPIARGREIDIGEAQ